MSRRGQQQQQQFALVKVPAWEVPAGIKDAEDLHGAVDEALLAWCKKRGMPHGKLDDVDHTKVVNACFGDVSSAPAVVAEFMTATHVHASIITPKGVKVATPVAYQFWVDANPDTIEQAKKAFLEVVLLMKLGLTFGRRYKMNQLRNEVFLVSTQHPAPNTQHPAPSTQHPAPSTQHPAPSTQGSI